MEGAEAGVTLLLAPVLSFSFGEEEPSTSAAVSTSAVGVVDDVGSGILPLWCRRDMRSARWTNAECTGWRKGGPRTCRCAAGSLRFRLP